MSVTVKQLAEMLNKSEDTIRRWIHEKRHIKFGGYEYRYEKDSGGRDWRFEKVKLMSH